MPIVEANIHATQTDVMLGNEDPLRDEVLSALSQLQLHLSGPKDKRYGPFIDANTLAFRHITRGDMTVFMVGPEDIVRATEEVSMPDGMESYMRGDITRAFFWKINLPDYEERLEGLYENVAYHLIHTDSNGEVNDVSFSDLIFTETDGTLVSNTRDEKYRVYFVGVSCFGERGGVKVFK